MATKKATKVVVEPTTHDIRIAEAILEQSKLYTGEFTIKFSRAARDYNYASYAALPTGVKTYISRVANKVKARKGTKKKKQATLSPTPTENLADFLKENLPDRVKELAKTDRALSIE